MKLLYFHIGPGMNSNPEKNLLLEPFKEAGFDLLLWNEPSVLRNDNIDPHTNAFQQYLDAAEVFFLKLFNGEPLVIVGHSFGSHAVCYLENRHPEKIKKVVFISSGLSLKNTDINIFTFVKKDFKKDRDKDNAATLQKCIKNYSGAFDSNTTKGFEMLIKNPRLFSYYWFNKDKMKAAMQLYNPPEFGIDLEGFFKVRQSWFERSYPKTIVPAIGIYGKHDIVVSNKVEQSILIQQFPNFKIYELEKSGHFPHIEETEIVLQILKRELQPLDNTASDSKGN